MADTITTECKVCEQVNDFIPALDGGVCDECREACKHKIAIRISRARYECAECKTDVSFAELLSFESEHRDLADFLRNAPLEEQIKVFTEAVHRANEAQQKLISKECKKEQRVNTDYVKSTIRHNGKD